MTLGGDVEGGVSVGSSRASVREPRAGTGPTLRRSRDRSGGRRTRSGGRRPRRGRRRRTGRGAIRAPRTPRARRALPTLDVGTTCCRGVSCGSGRRRGAPPRWRSWKPRREASARDTRRGSSSRRGGGRARLSTTPTPTPRRVRRGWWVPPGDESTTGTPWSTPTADRSVARDGKCGSLLETLLSRHPQSHDEGEPDEGGARLGRADDAFGTHNLKKLVRPHSRCLARRFQSWHQI